MWKIYKHTFPNGKIYIGQTKQSLKERFQNGQGYKDCPIMNRAIQKYGWENVTTEIIEDNIASLEEANLKEIYYITLYKSFNPNIGYNVSLGGQGNKTLDYNQIYKLWNDNLGINAIAHKLNCGRSSVARALESYGINVKERLTRMPQSISNSMRQFDRKAIYDAWITTPDYQTLSLQFNCSIDTIRRALEENEVSVEERRAIGQQKLASMPNGHNKKRINQYDLNGNFIKTFNSIAEANLSLGKAKNASNITSVCKGNRKSAYGFKWQYAT